MATLENYDREFAMRLDLTALDAIHEGVVSYHDVFWKEAKRTFQTAKREYRLRRIKMGG